MQENAHSIATCARKESFLLHECAARYVTQQHSSLCRHNKVILLCRRCLPHSRAVAVVVGLKQFSRLSAFQFHSEAQQSATHMITRTVCCMAKSTAPDGQAPMLPKLSCKQSAARLIFRVFQTSISHLPRSVG